MARSYQQGKQWGVRRPRDHNGYIEEWCPIRKRYVYQHRLIWEARIGRFLRVEEQVHHKDLNKRNNKEDNLEYHPTLASHIAAHRAEGNWGWKKGEPKPWAVKPNVDCPICGEPFKPGRRTNSKGEQVEVKTCSMSCGQMLRYRK